MRWVPLCWHHTRSTSSSKGGRHLMAVEDEVRQASEQFYAALNSTLNGDPGPMMEVWSHGADASAMHPFGSRSLGWEEVRASWEQAAQVISDGRVSDHQRGVEEEVVIPIGDDDAYTVGTERGQAKIGEELVRVDWRGGENSRREGGGREKGDHPTHVSPA